MNCRYNTRLGNASSFPFKRWSSYPRQSFRMVKRALFRLDSADVDPCNRTLQFNTKQGKQVSYATISFLCYFSIFIHYMVPTMPTNYVLYRIILTKEAIVLLLIGLHPAYINNQGGNYYADNVLFSNCLHICVILTFTMENEVGSSCDWSHYVSLNTDLTRESLASLIGGTADCFFSSYFPKS